MKQLNKIKEKINKITSDIDRMERLGISGLDVDILLEDIREIYKSAINLEEASEEKHDLEEKIENNTAEEIEFNETVEEIKKAEKTEEKETVDEKADLQTEEEPEKEEQKIETDTSSQTDQTISNAGTGSPEITEIKREKPEVKQSKLFDNNNNHEVKKVLGEQLVQNKRSLNEKFARFSGDVSDRVKLSPLSDIKSGIGLGDRFLYIRELFGGSNDLFEETIKKLNDLDSMERALHYLDENFNWNAENPTVITFLNVVRRKYL